MTKTDHTLVIAELDPHNKAIREDEGRSIKARWEFGRVLLDHRGDNGRLPHGLRAEIKKQYGLEASEITRRMQLAEKFKTEEKLVDACTRWGGSWRRIIREELPKTPRKEKPEPSFNELAKTQLAWLRGVAQTPERCQEWMALLRAELREAETAAELAA
jgi:hypothetical protein